MKIREYKQEDIDILKDWLNRNHIKKFFGNPSDWINEITENLTADWITYFIVENPLPIGFLQYYETDIAPQGDWSGEPIGTVGIDYFIGEEKNVGKGYGAKIIGLLIDVISSKNEYDYIIADPIADNIASVKVLEKNGFIQQSNGLYSLCLTNSKIKIYRATKQDVAAITELFRDTIQNINVHDYNSEEIEDWASWWTEKEKWRERIEEQYFITAAISENIVGFSSLASDGYLDFMFSHKDFQGHGIASKLLKKIERKAKIQGNNIIYSDVSITAKGFFEKHGFSVEKQQLKRSKNKELVNYRMIKRV